MSPKQAAVKLGCDAGHVRWLIRHGRLPAEKVLSENNKHGYEFNISAKAVSQYKRYLHARPKRSGYPIGRSRSAQ